MINGGPKDPKKGLLVSLIEVDLSNKKQVRKLQDTKSKSFILLQNQGKGAKMQRTKSKRGFEVEDLDSVQLNIGSSTVNFKTLLS